MKLVHPDLEGQFDFDREDFFEWIIEAPTLLIKYLQELYAQIQGKEGNFVLSDGGEELSLGKTAELLIDPFAVDSNDRKILNKLYGKLNDCAIGEDMYLQTQEVMSALQNYFYLLEEHSEYMLEAQEDINVVDLFKIMGIRLVNDADDFLETLINYITVCSGLLKKRLLIFVNLEGYLNAKQCEEVVKAAVYNEMKILFIESAERGYFTGKNRYIIDQDGCEIFR